jgi:hypothetical protein
MRLGTVRQIFVAFAFAVAGTLAACTSPPAPPTFPDIHFTGETPIRLAVSTVQIRSDFRPTFQSPHVEHLFPVTPEHALDNWVHDRLVAAGGSNAYARVVIKDASVVEVELKKKKEGITGVFTTEPAQRYDASIDATLQIIDDTGTPVRNIDVQVTRSQSVLEGITPNQRDQVWYDMTKTVMDDFDKEMTAKISAYLGGYFQ